MSNTQHPGISVWPSSVTLWASRLTCDHGNCQSAVTAVVMVTSGTSAVEIRTACDQHVDNVHAGWSNKQVAIVRVNQPRA